MKTHLLFLKTLVFFIVLTIFNAVQSQTLDRVAVAGWSKPISEITNFLAEPD